jgi:hypothetical protein
VQILGFLLVFSQVHLQYKKCINVYRTLVIASAVVVLLAIVISVYWKDNINFWIAVFCPNERTN